MAALALVPMIERLYRQLGITELISEEALPRAFAQLEAGLLRVTVDVRTAMTRGVALADAVRDDLEYPHLYAAHAGLDDILAGSVSKEFEHWVRRIRQMPTPPIFAELQRALASMATGAGPWADAARFLLFEGVRTNLLFARWQAQRASDTFDVPEYERDVPVLIDDVAIDAIAEREIECLIAIAPIIPDGVSPLQAMLAAAMGGLAEHAEAIRAMLAHVDDEIIEGLAERARFERAVRTLEPMDAVLLRNELAPRLGEQQLSTKELRRAHPVLLGSHTPNALDQQISRLRRRLHASGADALKPRVRPSLYQLMYDLIGDKP